MLTFYKDFISQIKNPYENTLQGLDSFGPQKSYEV